MKTYINDNNLLCVEEDGNKNFYELSFLLSQKDKINELKIQNEDTIYQDSDELSAEELKIQILALRDVELEIVNQLITQAENLNCK